MEMPNAKLDALRRKEADVRAAIAEEKVRLQKRREKDDARAFLVIGEALIRAAAQAPDVQRMLKQVLQSAEMRDADRAFLAGRGWV